MISVGEGDLSPVDAFIFLKPYFRTRYPVLGANFQLIFKAADGKAVAFIVVEAVDIRIVIQKKTNDGIAT